MNTSLPTIPNLGRLLIADDESEILDALCELLSLQGYLTVGCGSGGAALEALRAQEFDVLLTDLMMPGMDGISLLQAANEIDPDLIGIVMTGQGTVQTAVEAMKLGAYDYLLKPCGMGELLPMLERCVEKRRLRQENLQLRESMALYELSQAITISLDWDTVLDKLADSAMEHFGADEVAVLLPTENGDELYVAVARGENRERLVGRRTPMNGGIAGWAATRREPLLLHGPPDDPSFSASYPRTDISSSITMPMMAANKLVGVLTVNSTGRIRAFTSGQVKALSILASTAAAAMEGANLNKQVRESEERYRTLSESSPDHIFIIDRNGIIQYINTHGAAAFGLLPKDVIGKSQSELFPPEVAANNGRNLARVVADRAARSNESKLVFAGRTVWHSTNLVPLMNAAGEVHAIMGVSRNITERKEAEEALRLSEERFRQMAETIDEVFWMTDPAAGQMLYISPAYEALWGRTCQSLYENPMSFVEAIHPDDRGRVLSIMQDKSRVGHFHVEYRVLRSDGSVRWIWDQAFPVLDEQGIVRRVAGIAQDITERKRIEIALRIERDFNSTVVDTVGSLVVVLDREARIVRFNRACEQLTHYTFEEAEGRNLIDLLVMPEDREATVATFGSLRAGNFPNTYQNSWVGKDGSHHLIAWSNACIVDAKGEVEFIMGTGTDITESSRMEEELRKSRDDLEIRVAERTAELANTNDTLHQHVADRQMAMGALRDTVVQLESAKEEAERANAAKSEFLSRMSHELRTPMNSILGFAQLMEMHAIDDRQSQRVGHIIKAGRHLLQLINEVLDMARVEGGKLSLSPEPISINTTILCAVDLVRPLCQQRDLKIFLDIDKCGSLFVNADQQRLTQVFLNLLSNATKYNRQSGEVRVTCQMPNDGCLRVGIGDTGAGIAPENLARLFQPFERLGADSTIEGTGLGLALSKHLIEAMGGTLGVDSVIGIGSTFWLELPITDSPLKQVRETPCARHAITVTKDSNILYIEDNLANLQIIEHVMEDYPNIRLVSAMQGQLGLDLARQHRPALILLDLHLPDLNGDEVLRRLKADPLTASLPVVMLSADASPNQIQRLKELGASEYITKPLDVRHFLEVVQRILHRKEA